MYRALRKSGRWRREARRQRAKGAPMASGQRKPASVPENDNGSRGGSQKRRQAAMMGKLTVA
ncbi:hypothetical protein HPP92_024450 [Vanilla planifolia]|uniref:Uncharacterized protein n=1 Tax=Vanilla planifolia TaxID=51239 RepID=A0A835PS89_VANPL|nr:hypothetical protein HPP92_024752 [Vanilla planifolia]KAG0456662.1 hypothetical protein HPP92_024450 [Vanilla planifolia]